jgi:FlhB-like protein
MTIAAVIQSQMIQTLLQALQSAGDSALKGAAVEARFLGWNDTPEGGNAPARAAQTMDPTGIRLSATSGPSPALSTARVEIDGRPVTLVIQADAGRRAALTPGAVLTLAVERPAAPDQPAQMRLVGIAGERAAEAAPDPATARSISQPLRGAAPAEAPITELTPDRAALQAVRAAAGPLMGPALARQAGLAPLFADLEALARAPLTPQPVLAAAQAALALRLRPEELHSPASAGRRIEKAVKDSGLLHEAQTARGPAAASLPDLKGALLALRQSLREALGPAMAALAMADADQPATEAGVVRALAPPALPEPSQREARAQLNASPQPAAQTPVPPRLQPPLRDGLPVPQGVAEPSISVADSASTMMAKVLERTEAAIDRISLSQFASLPSAQDAAQGAPTNRWLTELPLALDGRTAVLPLEIEEDRSGPGAQGAQARLWRIRFALDVEPMGPVHALVTMQGRDIGVAVWAAREATSRLVRDHAPDLKAALLDADFDKAEIEVIAGQLSGPPLMSAARKTAGVPRRMAVALQYDGSAAPRVTAKGQGEIADRIVETARAAGVPIEENALLAQALSGVELDDQIPEDLYKAVAQVIGFVLGLRQRQR